MGGTTPIGRWTSYPGSPEIPNSRAFNQTPLKTTYSWPTTMTRKWRRNDQEMTPRVVQRRNRRMSTVAKTSPPERSYSHLVNRTLEAFHVAQRAAATAAEGIATASSPLLNTLREREKELDSLDREIDAGVTLMIAHVTESEARELLACMKFMISLERIGDLLLSFASSAQAAGGRLDPQDTRDLTRMATVLEKMLTDAGAAFSTRDLKKAVDVLRADAEVDRLRNLIFLRHIENPENVPRHASLEVIFMTQSLERAGDHAKNLAEEVCHFVSGHTVRHVLMTYDKPIEQMFLDWLRDREPQH